MLWFAVAMIAARRVQLGWQILPESLPLELRPLPGTGSRPVQPLRAGVSAAGRHADVAVDIAADQVLGRRLPVHRRVDEVAAVPGLAEPEPREVRRGARFRGGAPHRVGQMARRVLEEDWSVAADLELVTTSARRLSL